MFNLSGSKEQRTVKKYSETIIDRNNNSGYLYLKHIRTVDLIFFKRWYIKDIARIVTVVLSFSFALALVYRYVSVSLGHRKRTFKNSEFVAIYLRTINNLTLT